MRLANHAKLYHENEEKQDRQTAIAAFRRHSSVLTIPRFSHKIETKSRSLQDFLIDIIKLISQTLNLSGL